MARHARPTTLQRARRRGAATFGALGAAAAVTVVAPTGAVQAAAPWAGVQSLDGAVLSGPATDRLGDFLYGTARNAQDTQTGYATSLKAVLDRIPGLESATIVNTKTYSEDSGSGNVRDHRDQLIEFQTVGGDNGFAIVRSSSVRTDGRKVKDWSQGQINEVLLLRAPLETALKIQANLHTYQDVRASATNPGGFFSAGTDPKNPGVPYPPLLGVDVTAPGGDGTAGASITRLSYDLRDNGARALNAGSYNVGAGYKGLGSFATTFAAGSLVFDDKAIRFTAPSVTVTTVDADKNTTTTSLSGGTYRATEGGVTVGKYDDPSGPNKPQLGTNPGVTSKTTDQDGTTTSDRGLGVNGSADSTPSANVVVRDAGKDTPYGTDSVPSAPSIPFAAPAEAPASSGPATTGSTAPETTGSQSN